MSSDPGRAERPPSASRSAVRLHVSAIAVVLLCLAAGAFELKRALGGNELSWLYVFEWPMFAGFAAYMWWRFLHEDEDKATPARAGNAEPERDGSAMEQGAAGLVTAAHESVERAAPTRDAQDQVARELAAWRRGMERRTHPTRWRPGGRSP